MERKSPFRDVMLPGIRQWATRAEKPPYRVKSMVMFALIDMSQGLTQAEIVEWITDHFRFWKLCANTSLLLRDGTAGFSADLTDNEIATFQTQFDEVFNDIDIPFRVYGTVNGAIWSISPTAGEAAARVRSITRAGPPFRFMDLAPELRNKIYEMAFQLPKSGIAYSPHETKFTMLTDDLSQPSNFAHWQAVDKGTPLAVSIPRFSSPAVGKLLGPLRVSWQFYKEAMPLFYEINHFHFANVHDMYEQVTRISDARRKHIEHISFTYSRSTSVHREERVAASIFGTMCRIKYLTRLDICIDEAEWLRHSGHVNGAPSGKYSSVMNMAGLGTLHKFRGLTELNFRGCPTIEAAFKADMIKPKKVITVTKQKRTISAVATAEASEAKRAKTDPPSE